ncbi:MAG: hypothetical protein ACLFOY_03295 [Desulfatibacillaceae bacterium]
MLRFGAERDLMREMNEQDLRLGLLALLVAMCKAHLDECPFGVFRRHAVVQCARWAGDPSFCEVVERLDKEALGGEGIAGARAALEERVALMVYTVRGFGENRTLDGARRQALEKCVKEMSLALLGRTRALSPRDTNVA